jgi:hypothetical protein
MSILARLDRAYFAPAPAERLATLRVLVGAFAWVYLTARLPYFVGLAARGPDRFAPIGLLAPLEAPLPPILGYGGIIVTWVLAGAFTLGWRHRWTGPAFAVALTALLTYRSSFGMIFHTENLLVVHVWILAVTDAGAALAWRRAEPPPPDDGRFGWPVRLMMGATVAAYFVAGLAKVQNAGWSWVGGEVLMGHVAFDALRKMQVGSLHSPIGAMLLRVPWIFGPLALGSLVLELGAPLFLLARPLRHLWAVGVWCFHVGVLLLMFIFFPYPIVGVGLASFFAVERLPAAVRRWRSRRRDGASRSAA